MKQEDSGTVETIREAVGRKLTRLSGGVGTDIGAGTLRELEKHDTSSSQTGMQAGDNGSASASTGRGRTTASSGSAPKRPSSPGDTGRPSKRGR
jgi:hypothetical protein